jgi:hypothetical protein
MGLGLQIRTEVEIMNLWGGFMCYNMILGGRVNEIAVIESKHDHDDIILNENARMQLQRHLE